jgi:hypothetical protein
VLLISVDGMHAIDLKRWVESHPGDNFAKLIDNGVVYPNALAPGPSDSYPGMLAQVTGATPKTGGLFYDDSYDRTEFPAKAFYTSQGLADPGCVGNPGAELTNFEALDKSYNYSTALVADFTGGGTVGQVYTQLDPDHMQRKLVNGKWVPVFPHEYVRTNTIFEVIKAAGMRAVWSDKHPELTRLYEDPFHNSRVPDFIAITDHGVICTGGSKLAEHGGFSKDDRNVALLVSSPRIKQPKIVQDTAFTTQIAPTILDALDLDPRSLKAVREGGVEVLK